MDLLIHWQGLDALEYPYERRSSRPPAFSPMLLVDIPDVGNRSFSLVPRAQDSPIAGADVGHNSPGFQETVEEIERIKVSDLKKPAKEKSNIVAHAGCTIHYMDKLNE